LLYAIANVPRVICLRKSLLCTLGRGQSLTAPRVQNLLYIQTLATSASLNASPIPFTSQTSRTCFFKLGRSCFVTVPLTQVLCLQFINIRYFWTGKELGNLL